MDSCALREQVLTERAAAPEIVPLAESTTQKTMAASGEPLSVRPRPHDIAAPPCFFASVCRQRAAVEKAGRSVCHGCAGTRLRGLEYPLRNAVSEPLYVTGRAASEALDMVEDISQRARRGLRGGVWS
jgi:hypothetical protein